MGQQAFVHPLETAAKSALSNDSTAIHMLTDAVINDLPLMLHPSLNMSDRLFQAELQYRQEKLPGITVRQLVSALNQLADDLNLPVYVKTDVNQMEMYCGMAVRVYPSFVPPYDPKQSGDWSLSPLAATHRILHLLSLKLTEPSYQTDPDTWVRETIALRKAASKTRSRSTTVSFHVSKSTSVQSPDYRAIASGLATNSGPALPAVLRMLATLGI